MFSRRKLAAVLLMVTATVGGWAAPAAVAPAPKEYKLVKDIPYYSEKTTGLDAYQQERCRLDVYFQVGGKNLPVVVWFHGGGLTGGNKAFPGGLKNKDLVLVAVNYRLSPKAKCVNSIEDAAAAVAWTFDHIAEYGGDPKKIFISGHSAGGYLTMMVGLDPKWLAPYKIDLDRIAGLIPFSGHTITHMTVRKERGISDKQPVIDEFAPLYHVRGKNPPPLLLITGDREKEMLGRYEENAYMMRMMKVNGHQQVTLYELQGYGHGMVDPAVPLLLDFIKKACAVKK